MAVVPFPDPVTRYAQEIEDALEPVRAICLEAASRLPKDQRVELDAQVVILTTEASAPLTDSVSWEEQQAAVDALIKAVEEQ